MSSAAIYDLAALRLVALAYWQRRRGFDAAADDRAAREAAQAAYLARHTDGSRTEAEAMVDFVLLMARAPEPDRETLHDVTHAFRDARFSGASDRGAFDMAVHAHRQRHRDVQPLEAAAAVARILAVAVERSPRWFWTPPSASSGERPALLVTGAPRPAGAHVPGD